MPLSALHHSRMLRFRSPFGAVPAGEAVTLRLWVNARYANASVTLRMWIGGEERLLPMEGTPGDGGVYFEATARLYEPGLAWYYFLIAVPGGKPLFYGGESGEGALYPHEPPGYQVTVYDPGFAVPRAFREGIMYQIFPDRFRRSELFRDGTHPGVAYHRALGRNLCVQRDWYARPKYLPEEGREEYEPDDFYCGDLYGIMDALPYLKSLHVDTLYLNPVFESASNHRYDTADYQRVDPILGGNEALIALAEAAKKEGVRLMLDGVFSHTGADSAYFNKYARYPAAGAFQGEASPYRRWYDFDPRYEHGYRCWWGFPELPEVNELDESYSAFIAGEKESLLQYWAERGISSWRLDVADELPDEFLRLLRARLKARDPDGVLLGEVWEDASNKVSYGSLRMYVQGRTLDCVMGYPFRAAVADYLLGKSDAYALNHGLQVLREHYPKPFYYAQMNLLSTHDTVRALTMLSGAPDRDALTREAQAEYALTPEARALGRRRLMLAAAIQMVLPGVPSIYYGDEAGMDGMADPFNRAAYPWGKEDGELIGYYRRLTAARAGSAALRAGYCRMGAVNADVFAILRYTASGRDAFLEEAPEAAALLLCNRSPEPQRIGFDASSLSEGPDANVPCRFDGVFRDALTRREWTFSGGRLAAQLPPYGMLLLQKGT
ncbi:MAG TPA: glycoside hydrolase family 13 protein [Feifaniaceae bacterium]|nr:glycoside hydrolase family 13 protein [Feifaniaceae bacterium]